MVKVKNFLLLAGFVVLACLMILTISPVSKADNLPKPPPAQPVQLAFAKFFDDYQYTGFDLASYSVPSDKRLVLEFASVVARITVDEPVTFAIETTVNGTTVNHFVNLAKGWVYDNYPFYEQQETGSKLVRLYADPGTTVNIKATRYTKCTNGGCPGDFYFQGSISGYLEAP